jgi:nucleoid DNA-binding protein
MRATYEYVKENMQAGRGVNIRGFGAFAFEIQSGLIKPAQLI